MRWREARDGPAAREPRHRIIAFQLVERNIPMCKECDMVISLSHTHTIHICIFIKIYLYIYIFIYIYIYIMYPLPPPLNIYETNHVF